MPRYRTVLFDADQTLMDFKRSERAALTETVKRTIDLYLAVRGEGEGK